MEIAGNKTYALQFVLSDVPLKSIPFTTVATGPQRNILDTLTFRRNDKRHTLIRQKFNSPFSQTNNQHSSSSDHNIQTHNFHSHYYEDLQHQLGSGSLSSTRSRSVDAKTGFQNQTLTTSEHINTRQERTRERKPLHCSWHRVDSASLLMQQYSLDHWHFDLFHNIIDFRMNFGKN